MERSVYRTCTLCEACCGIEVALEGDRIRALRGDPLDQMPKQLVSHWMYGSGFSVSVPDLDRTDDLLMIGANPVVSNGSLLTAPGMKRRLRELRERGGRVVLIDPRRNETAASVDRHGFIRPGTDALLLAALVHWVIHEKRVRIGSLPIDPAQIDAVAAFVQPFAPEQVAACTGRLGIVPSADTARLHGGDRLLSQRDRMAAVSGPGDVASRCERCAGPGTGSTWA